MGAFVWPLPVPGDGEQDKRLSDSENPPGEAVGNIGGGQLKDLWILQLHQFEEGKMREHMLGIIKYKTDDQGQRSQ